MIINNRNYIYVCSYLLGAFLGWAVLYLFLALHGSATYTMMQRYKASSFGSTIHDLLGAEGTPVPWGGVGVIKNRNAREIGTCVFFGAYGYLCFVDDNTLVVLRFSLGNDDETTWHNHGTNHLEYWPRIGNASK